MNRDQNGFKPATGQRICDNRKSLRRKEFTLIERVSR